MNNVQLLFIIALSYILGQGCNTSTSGNELGRDPDIVVVGISSRQFPFSLHPTLEYGIKPFDQLYLPLTAESPEGQRVPVLLESMPEPNDSHTIYTFKIRPEAQWDDGTPITAADAVFSIKAYLCPQSSHIAFSSYLDHIEEIITDPNDKRIFRLKMKPSQINPYLSDELKVFPRAYFDPDNVLEKYTPDQLRAIETLQQDSVFTQWADKFSLIGTEEEILSNNKDIPGSGPYKVEEWLPEEYILLSGKDDYWGSTVGPSIFLQQGPPQIKYIVAEPSRLILSREADIVMNINPLSYEQLLADSLDQVYEMNLLDGDNYAFIAFNLQPEEMTGSFILLDTLVRKAIAHLIPIDEVAVSRYGKTKYVDRVVSPVKSSLSEFNQSLTPIPYHPELARSLLAEAGWTDSNNNGILDKQINGTQEELALSLVYKSGNVTYETIATYMQSALGKAGIDCRPLPIDPGTFNEQASQHFYDAIIQAFSFQAPIADFEQVWHTDSWENGYNFSGFGNDYTDRLIDSIRLEPNPQLREELSRKLQRIIYDSHANIFLFSPKQGIAVHKRFQNEKIYPNYPYIVVNELIP